MITNQTIALDRVKYINPEEFKKLLDATRKESELYYYAFFICGNLGLRVSELLTLKKSDFDLHNNIVTIMTLKQRADKIDKMEIPLEVIKLIKPYLKTIKKPDGLLFPYGKRTLQYKFDYFAGKAGIKIKGTNTKKGRGIHCLRHLRGFLLAETTRDPYTIAKALRHSSINTSMAYVHLKDYNATIQKVRIIK